MKKIKVLNALFSKIMQTSSGGSVVSFWGASCWCCKKLCCLESQDLGDVGQRAERQPG